MPNVVVLSVVAPLEQGKYLIKYSIRLGGKYFQLKTSLLIVPDSSITTKERFITLVPEFVSNMVCGFPKN
jgi:hypothetical protein